MTSDRFAPCGKHNAPYKHDDVSRREVSRPTPNFTLTRSGKPPRVHVCVRSVTENFDMFSNGSLLTLNGMANENLLLNAGQLRLSIQSPAWELLKSRRRDRLAHIVMFC
jgi:hypothetical protein